MVPAKQRFGTRDFAGDEAQLGLESEQEFVALDGFGQRPLGLHLLLVLGGQLIIEQAMLAAAARLGVVHRDVGGAHQGFDRRSVVGTDRNADRGADIDAVPAELERLGDRQRDAARDAFDVGRRLDVREEQSEFIAGEARQQRPALQRLAEFRGDHDPKAVGDHDQQLVAAGMTKAVVNQLEPVEVDEQHRRACAHWQFAEQFVGLGAEMKAVGKRGHRVVHAKRVGILDRGADFGKKRVHGGRDLGHNLANRGRRRGNEVAVLDREQAVAERRKGAGILAVGALRGDVADQQAERAGD